MPELPEVEVTRRGIAARADAGSASSEVIARVPALRYPCRPILANCWKAAAWPASRAAENTCCSTSAVGHLLIHLGMSGSLRLVTAAQPAAKHDHLDLVFGPRTGPSPALRDPRRFGAVLWLEGDAEAHPLLKVLGIEPLTEEFDAPG
jgi:formamidopyrimidine-DNA glycosylase